MLTHLNLDIKKQPLVLRLHTIYLYTVRKSSSLTLSKTIKKVEHISYAFFPLEL